MKVLLTDENDHAYTYLLDLSLYNDNCITKIKKIIQEVKDSTPNYTDIDILKAIQKEYIITQITDLFDKKQLFY